MKCLAIACTLALLGAPAFAQTTSSGSPGSQANQSAQATQSSSNSNRPQTAAAAQKLKQTLESEGFTDVKVVAQSFVVQGKSPDGDPVVMTIGPHGMSVFEAMNAGSGQTTGSNTQSSTQNPSHASPSTSSNPQTQK
jgi:hypothetical protein